MDGTISFSVASSISTRRALQEETANQITHGLGAALAVAGTAVLLPATWATGDWLCILGCSIYALSMIAVFAASTLSHSFADTQRRNRWRMVDQACIFLFMAGNFTPFALVHLCHGCWWILLAAVWGYALCGVRARMRCGAQSISARYFVLLGMAPVVCWGEVMKVSQSFGATLMLLGGACYFLGIVFFLNDRKCPYFHAVWHVLVIAGCSCHFLFVLYFVAGVEA